MATVKSQPATLGSLRKAADLVKKEAVKVDTNRDGKVSRAEVERYAKSIRNKQVGQALVVAHGLGSRSMNGSSSISVNQLKTGVDLALGYVSDRDANRNGRIDAGAELTSAEKLKSFQALAGVASSLNLNQGGDGLASLKAAVRRANTDEMSGWGKGFGVAEFAAGVPQNKLLAKMFDVDVEDMENIEVNSVGTGRAAVAKYVDNLAVECTNLVDGIDDAAEIRKLKAAYFAMEGAVQAFFDSGDFKKISYLHHGIAEDGDTEHAFLIAERKDGSKVVLDYTNFPF